MENAERGGFISCWASREAAVLAVAVLRRKRFANNMTKRATEPDLTLDLDMNGMDGDRCNACLPRKVGLLVLMMDGFSQSIEIPAAVRLTILVVHQLQ